MDALITKCRLQRIHEERTRRFLDETLGGLRVENISSIIDRLSPLKSTGGGNDSLCAPTYNKSGKPGLKFHVLKISLQTIGILLLLPMQLASTAYLGLWCWNWKAIIYEIPRPSIRVLYWISEDWTFIKPTTALVRESIESHKALCVNREGVFKLIGPSDPDKYAMLSYSWS